MKNTRTLCAFSLLVPFLLGLGTTAERIEYRPAEGITIAKKAEIENHASLDEMSMTMDGQDMSSMMGSFEMTIETTHSVSVNDQYASMGEGRPARLKRTFDAISSTTHLTMRNQMTGDTDQDMPGSSELEGLSVVFAWNEDAGEYDVTFAEGTEGDEELLENLAEDMDLRAFLPDQEVAVGDTWKVPVEAAKAVFAPGGALKVVPEESDDFGPTPGSNMSPDEMIGDIDGEILAELTGIREEDGKRLAAIKIKLDVNSANDLSEKLQDLDDEMPEGMPTPKIQSMDLEFEFKGEGELVWDLGLGLFHSLDLSGDVAMVMDMAMSLDIQGGEKQIEQSMSFSGTQSITMSAGE